MLDHYQRKWTSSSKLQSQKYMARMRRENHPLLPIPVRIPDHDINLRQIAEQLKLNPYLHLNTLNMLGFLIYMIICK
jgi:hypothetical protein